MSNTATIDHLNRLMSRYVTDDEEFREHIQSLPGTADADIEGYDPATAVATQRDLSLTFTWGHDHDFGNWQMKGHLGDRHVRVIADFVDRCGLPLNLTGQRVLDVGCWTGGTSLLLAAMGAHVLAVEEVVKYAKCTELLFEAFDVDGVVFDCSVYEISEHLRRETWPLAPFDYVICAGVLYHVTDPVVLARVLYNALKPGGVCFIETEVVDRLGLDWLYRGPQCEGWCWFVPTRYALHRLLEDVGFDTVTSHKFSDSRFSAKAVKGDEPRDMLRAGLSMRVA
jgi:2-polyprenyl-3-methyl-5-hydroxy-6-metoxy-1,4-benzoquinol methylase